MMVQLLIHGRNITITEGIYSAVHDKLGRVFAHFDFLKRADITVNVDKNPRIHEKHHVLVVLHVNGGMLKLEAASDDLYSALDETAEKSLNTLRKYKNKHLKRTKAGRSAQGTSLRVVGFEAALAAEAFMDYDDVDITLLNDMAAQDPDTLVLAELQQQESERQERELQQRYPEAYAS
jgi:ribosomal subunit interface protein